MHKIRLGGIKTFMLIKQICLLDKFIGKFLFLERVE